MAWYNNIFGMFDKLDDAFNTIVDATFGWSKTLQEKHLDNIRTRNKKEIMETQQRLEEEKRRLEFEMKKEEERLKLDIEKEKDEQKRINHQAELELIHQDMKFKIDMVEKLTQIVSGLQNEHSRRVMALLTDYKRQQIEIISALKDSHKNLMKELAEESKEYKDDFPEIYNVKIEQQKAELATHQKLIGDITDGMSADLQRIQNWLLDSSRFNAEEFILKISGSKDDARNFQKYLDNNNIDVEILTEEETSDKQ
jgi:hypothetical protein